MYKTCKTQPFLPILPNSPLTAYPVFSHRLTCTDKHVISSPDRRIATDGLDYDHFESPKPSYLEYFLPGRYSELYLILLSFDYCQHVLCSANQRLKNPSNQHTRPDRPNPFTPPERALYLELRSCHLHTKARARVAMRASRVAAIPPRPTRGARRS